MGADRADSDLTGLVDLAKSYPSQAMEAGRDALNSLSDNDHASRSVVLRALCIAARAVATIGESIRYGERSLVEAEMSGDVESTAEAVVTLAGSVAISGDPERALTLLDDTAENVPVTVIPRLQFQRATILSMRGDVEEALEAFSIALPEFRRQGDETFEAVTLHNRGLLRLYAGDHTGARADLNEARALHIKNGFAQMQAGVEHNLGLLAAYQGDIPEALRRLTASDEIHKSLTEATVPDHATRCEVLISAGLFREALDVAMRVVEDKKSKGAAEDEAEASILAAQAAILANRPEQAAELATSAAVLFESQGRSDWLLNAHRLEVQARYESGESDADLLRSAGEVADQLAGGSLLVPAHGAQLVAGLMALDLGEIEEATRRLTSVANVHTGPVELRLQAWLAKARLLLASGNTKGADAAARAGFRLLYEYQAAFGASDIRAGIERHSQELGSLGLRLAIDAGRPKRVLSWMERVHFPFLRLRPVIPPDDDDQAKDLAQLRQASADLRKNDVSKSAALIRTQQQLQESIRQRSRLATSEVATRSHSVPSIAELVEALGERILLEFTAVDDRLWAVTIEKGRFHLSEVGDEARIVRELEQLRFSMRRSARLGGDDPLDRELQRLDRLLFGKLSSSEEAMVLVPSSSLFATPWSALPSLGGRALTVAPSAELWLRAHRSPALDGSVVVIGGPDLIHADDEVAEVSSFYPSALRLAPDEATVEAVTTALEGTNVAHIASHAFFETDNPMFSSLRLADGDLYVYDIERLAEPPSFVILSACDSGFTETHAGDELLGMSAALLSMGSKTVVASVGLVPDAPATKGLMTEFHRLLVAGVPPATALRLAQDTLVGTPEGQLAAASFVCIGAG